MTWIQYNVTSGIIMATNSKRGNEDEIFMKGEAQIERDQTFDPGKYKINLETLELELLPDEPE